MARASTRRIQSESLGDDDAILHDEGDGATALNGHLRQQANA
jgi:hypothetical protein